MNESFTESITIENGEFFLVCGASGSGKTTFLRKKYAEYRKNTVRAGYVMQDVDAQIVTDTVWHEIAFGLENMGITRETMHRRVAEIAAYFGMDSWLDRDTSVLSGGEKQLLNLASVLILHPDVLILDEPTSQLDPVAADTFLNTLKKLNRELGITVILSEHRLEAIFPDCSRCMILDGGTIAALGTPEHLCRQIYEEKRELFEFLPETAKVFLRHEKNPGNCPLTVNDGRKWLRRAAAGKSAPFQAAPRPKNQPEPAFSVKHLSFRYQKHLPELLSDVTVSVPEQSIFAIMGANGSGKTTLLKILSGVKKPSSGTVVFPNKIQKKTVLLFPQNARNLFTKKSVREELNSDARELFLSFVAESAPDEKKTKTQELLARHPYDLSSGELQKLALAVILEKKPDILLLDEPTKGLDALFKKELSAILRRLAQNGMTIVIVCHDIEFCARTADFTCLLFQGKIVACDSTRNFCAGNIFYTTMVNRMCRGMFDDAITEADVLARLSESGAEK